MYIQSTLKILLMSLAVLLATGCKLAVIVVENGHVQSIGSDYCFAGEVCIINIMADDFTETFTAVPDPGYEFVRWSDGADFLCSDEASAVCTLTNVGAGAVPAAAAIIASDKTYYLMPIFEAIVQPITDTVVADGREWAQPVDFLSVPYADIAAACPGGVCSGTLNTFEMSGWTWAGGVEVASLLNTYSGSGLCPSFPCLEIVGGGVWTANATAAGFQLTGSFVSGFNYDVIVGYTSEPEPSAFGGLVSAVSALASCVDVGGSAGSCTPGAQPLGAWFYR